MKVIEEYVQRRVDKLIEEKDEQFVISLKQEGYSIVDIARILDINEDFVKKTLAKSVE